MSAPVHHFPKAPLLSKALKQVSVAACGKLRTFTHSPAIGWSESAIPIRTDKACVFFDI
jgi:hypothetical protein